MTKTAHFTRPLPDNALPAQILRIRSTNKVIHYSPYNGKVLPGYLFTDNGFWDTFGADFPFFTLMHPSLSSQIMEGLANGYDESGWLPEWASPGHRSCMIGSNSAVNIADAYLKGIRGFDIERLYEAILKYSENEDDTFQSPFRPDKWGDAFTEGSSWTGPGAFFTPPGIGQFNGRL